MREYNSEKSIIVRITPIFKTVEAIFKGQNKYISDNNYEVHVISSPDKEVFSISKANNFQHHSVNIKRNISVMADIISIISIIRILNKVKPDIVHTHTSKGGLVGMIAASVCGIKYKVHSVAGWTVDMRPRIIGMVISVCEKITLKLCTHVLVNSLSLKNHLIATGYLMKSKSYVLGSGSSNGVDLLEFTKNNENAVITKSIRERYNFVFDLC